MASTENRWRPAGRRAPHHVTRAGLPPRHRGYGALGLVTVGGAALAAAAYAATPDPTPAAVDLPAAAPAHRPRSTQEEPTMRGAVLHAPGDVRVEDRPDPRIEQPTDAVIRLAATCVCGSDLWPYRGIEPVAGPSPMGHEYVGVVEEVGSEVRTVQPGQFVVGSFFASDNTCEICRAGYQTSCVNRQPGAATGAQAEYTRVPLADGTLVATPGMPADDLVPSLLAASDVLGTGWFGAVAAEVGPGKTVAVVGDGAVGLLGVLAARQLGAERIIAMSRHEPRKQLAREFGATDIVTERGDEGVARIKDLTNGLGAHSVIEAVGTQESMMQAIRATRPGGHVGYVGVAHGVELPGEEMFFSHVHLHGGPAPVRRFLPELIDLICSRTIDPGKVFDLELPLEQAAEGYRAMDERRAVKTLLRP
ncbi:zinc-dependent alcohol dehydrogenase family protein [Geodermatophilus chilensis]|uniref:zinc-dependent alcohol dehydrogenase family protein n=1 Tax=Geodermatophilus chilensis TaxID=2035835 RepID=UPI001E5EE682|nr:zinc-dependent alcohol dehydrogenase family protein [Geodermatophilus chilensis]